MIRFFPLVVVFFLLTACSASNQDEAYLERSIADLYNEAAAALDDRRYKAASDLFDEVERQHPYSSWAHRAQIMSAYGYYKALKYGEVILALDRFIRVHPGSDLTSYAYYLRALSYYEQISDIHRDQKITELALRDLKGVVRRFPDSDYARDAKLKIDLAYDHLAGKKMEIGRYYLKRGQYHAAIQRFRAVIEHKNFSTTSHVPEALHRTVEGYLSLGLVDEALRAASVLNHNFPRSKWYQDSYALLSSDNYVAEYRKSWLEEHWAKKAWKSLF